MRNNSSGCTNPEFMLLAGVDEVGRGPLCGPVVAAAVILDPSRPVSGIADSKKLTARKRTELSCAIQQSCIAFAFGQAAAEEIDRLNILQASLLAMRRAVLKLHPVPQCALIDGDRIPTELPCPAKAIIQGDCNEPCISAASILAKVERDKYMCWLDRKYPGYGLAQHKGYPTRGHLEALERLGVTAIYRRSFKPVKKRL